MDVLRGFRRRPLRSSLLLLQVFFGTLVTTLALCAALGSRTPAAPPERFNLVAGYETENESGSYSVFNSRDLPELLELAPDAARLAVFGEMYNATVVVGDTRYALRAGAQVSAGYFGLEPLEIVRGTALSDAEIREAEPVALLSENAARAMFGDADPIGQDLNVETDDYNPDTPPEPPTPYRVVGTFNLSLTGADPYSISPALYLPFPGADDPTAQPASTLAVQAKPGQSEAARAQLLSAARRLYAKDVEEQGGKEGQDFMIKAPGDDTFGPEGINQDLLTFGLFGAVALVVSAIGIFSATLTETEERTHEIGVRRALGASAARVGWSLVGRSLGVALVGGASGVLGAALLIPVLRGPARDAALFGGTRLAFEPLAALVALGAVVLVSGLLGLVPAFRVGRLKPVQALRESV